MKKPKLSIVIPGIREENWERLYKEISESVKPYLFELIIVGPNFPKSEFLHSKLNFRYLRDFGSPSRCFQLGVYIADGEYICFIPDDCIIFPNILNLSLNYIGSKPKNHGMILLYSEGTGYSGIQHKWVEYWTASTHDDLKALKINPLWKIAPCFLYNKEYFMEIGGLDCSFEHVNCNAHSVAFVTQGRNNGELHFSPGRVFASDWEQPSSDNPTYKAYVENDAPKFKEMWSDAEMIKKYKVDFNNWMKTDSFWKRKNWGDYV